MFRFSIWSSSLLCMLLNRILCEKRDKGTNKVSIRQNKWSFCTNLPYLLNNKSACNGNILNITCED